MKGIFISYRRDDTASEARLLYNYLRREFGDDLVFMDVEALREPGADFIEAIHASLNQCDAVLAVMGRHWAGFDADTGSSRLDAPGDFIRMEIAMALQRRVRVIPVLVDGASMPPAETLPEDLRSLTRLQAVTLSHEDWEFHIGKLADALAKLLGHHRGAGTGSGTRSGATSGSGGGRTPSRWPWLAGGALLGVAALAGVAVITRQPGDNSQANLAPGTLMAVAPTETADNAAASATNQAAQLDASPERVAQAQRLLAELGYDAGYADGVPGPATADAVREFQDDFGAGGPPGQVSRPLLAMLERAVAEQRAMASSATTASATAVASNISGTWYTEEGVGFDVSQRGSQVAFYLAGQQVGEGRVDGNGFELVYSFPTGIAGQIIGTVDADGRHIRGTDSSNLGMVLPVVLHYEHFAQ